MGINLSKLPGHVAHTAPTHERQIRGIAEGHD